MGTRIRHCFGITRGLQYSYGVIAHLHLQLSWTTKPKRESSESSYKRHCSVLRLEWTPAFSVRPLLSPLLPRRRNNPSLHPCGQPTCNGMQESVQTMSFLDYHAVKKLCWRLSFIYCAPSQPTHETELLADVMRGPLGASVWPVCNRGGMEGTIFMIASIFGSVTSVFICEQRNYLLCLINFMLIGSYILYTLIWNYLVNSVSGI